MSARFTPIYLPDSKGKLKQYSLLFTLNALVLIENHLGKSIQTLFQEAQLLNDPNGLMNSLFCAQNLLVFLYAGLQEKHPEMDLDTLGQRITFEHYGALIKTVAESFLMALGGTNSESGGEKKNALGKKQTRLGPGKLSKNLVSK